MIEWASQAAWLTTRILFLAISSTGDLIASGISHLIIYLRSSLGLPAEVDTDRIYRKGESDADSSFQRHYLPSLALLVDPLTAKVFPMSVFIFFVFLREVLRTPVTLACRWHVARCTRYATGCPTPASRSGGEASRSLRCGERFPPYLSESFSDTPGLWLGSRFRVRDQSSPPICLLISSMQAMHMCSACGGNFGLAQHPMDDGWITVCP